MNNLLTYFGLAAVALYLNNRIKSTEKELEDYKSKTEDAQDQIDDLDSKISTGLDAKEGIKYYLKPSIKLYVAEYVYGPYWNGYFTIDFKNTSSDVVYMIKKVCATIEMDGYSLERYSPGEVRNSKVFAGKSVAYHGDYLHEIWYPDSTIRKAIETRFSDARKNGTKESNGSVKISDLMTATIYAKVESGNQNHIVVWNNIAADVYVFDPGSSFKSAGDNAFNWKKYDELFEQE